MRKIISLMHVSLDGFVAGPKGEMDWILYQEDEQKYSKEILNTLDTVIFGRGTYHRMESFWPTVSFDPVWSKSNYHVEHARWIDKDA